VSGTPKVENVSILKDICGRCKGPLGATMQKVEYFGMKQFQYKLCEKCFNWVLQTIKEAMQCPVNE